MSPHERIIDALGRWRRGIIDTAELVRIVSQEVGDPDRDLNVAHAEMTVDTPDEELLD